MNETTDSLEMISFPYYAHLQAQLANPAHSIAWNKVALLGYIDILLYAKDQIPPAGFQRKIRMLYEQYQNLPKTYPNLGDLDGLFRELNRINKDQAPQVIAIALKWHSIVQVIEKICLDLAARRGNFTGPSQLSEALQQLLYQMQLAAVLPKLNDFLDEEQEEITRLARLKQYPPTITQKIKLRHQFSGAFHTDKDSVHFLVEKDEELQELFNALNKAFFRLTNLINQKLPEPDRSLKTNQPSQDFSTPQDYRFVVNLYYDGNDENEYESGLLAKLRRVLRVT